jgi:luciferase family oxidoreductase group 1
MKLSILDQSVVPAGAAPPDALRATIRLAGFADRLGYDRYWLAEHHSTPCFASPAPEAMVARLIAETSGIRVGSGGVLLSHYSPLKVAEVFKVLNGLAPGRVDLGIGRSTGAGALETEALNPAGGVVDFTTKLAELMAFLGGGFPDGHPYSQITIMPTDTGDPQIWLLGTSTASAVLAGRLGLPYSYAHFGDPRSTRAAIELYRKEFDHGTGNRPRVLLGVGVYCADTAAEAERVFASQRLFRMRMDRGVLLPLPSPETALAELAGLPSPVPDPRTEWPRYLVGDPATVGGHLRKMSNDLAVEEFIVLSSIHGLDDRMRSFELLAEVCDVPPRDSSHAGLTASRP